jgi:hypothetical protein
VSATLKIRTQFALVTLLYLASALLCGVVNADELSAIRRIGVLDANFSATMGEGIRDGIRQAGYIEGKDIVLDWRRSLGPEESFAR